MTLNLEWVDDPAINRNFETLAQQSIDPGGISLGLRGGSDTVTFPGGSVNTSVLTVSHGLAATPTTIQLTAIAGATPLDLFVSSGSVNSTTFGVRGRTTDGSVPANGSTQTFYWLAIG